MERWRYCCGKCGSHTVESRVERGGYQCRVCDSFITSLHDKKVGGPVTVGETASGRTDQSLTAE